MELSVNKCYRVIRADDELLEQFNQFVYGAEFRVVQMLNDGIVAVQFRNGPFVSIKNNPDSWFWCFYSSDTLEEHQMELEEIVELSSSPINDENPIDALNGVPLKEILENRIKTTHCVIDEAVLTYISYLEHKLEFSDKAF